MRSVPFSHSSTSALLLSPFDVSSLGPGIISEDLPVVLGNPLHFERDSEFAHVDEYGSFYPAGKPLTPACGASDAVDQDNGIRFWRSPR
jgi:hypothetical protein